MFQKKMYNVPRILLAPIFLYTIPIKSIAPLPKSVKVNE